MAESNARAAANGVRLRSRVIRASCTSPAAPGRATARTWASPGCGVPQDDVQAVKWYRLAADQGDADAQSNLGLMYANGRGVPQDHVQAHKWFDLAGAGGDEDGRKNRDRLATRMTLAQIAEAQRLAREWQPKLAQY